MITRERAISVIYQLINSGVLNEELEDQLQDIANCIEEEKLGIHAWGMYYEDYITLKTAIRTDLPDSDPFIQKQKRIIAEHRFSPSKFEKREEV